MTVDQIVEEAIAIHVDTEGMPEETIDSIIDALYWALDKAGAI